MELPAGSHQRYLQSDLAGETPPTGDLYHQDLTLEVLPDHLETRAPLHHFRGDEASSAAPRAGPENPWRSSTGPPGAANHGAQPDLPQPCLAPFRLKTEPDELLVPDPAFPKLSTGSRVHDLLQHPWLASSVSQSFETASKCEASFDYVGSSSSWTRSSSKRDLSCRYT